MAFGKRRYGRKKRGKFATRAQLGALKRKVNPERKIGFASVAIGTATSLAGSFVEIGGITQGATELTRVGNQTKLQNLNMNLSVINTDAAVQLARFVLLRWDDEDLPTVGDVFIDTGAGVNVLSTINVNNVDAKKLHIIWDRAYTLSILNVNGAHKDERVFKSLHGYQQQYTASASTSGIRGRIFLFERSTDVQITFGMEYQQRYTDA